MTEKQYDTIIDESALEGAFVMIPLYVLHDERLSASSLKLYAHLKSYAFRGSCFPGMMRLADEWGVTTKTVQRNVADLEECGLVEVERDPNRTNRYTLKSMATVYFDSISPPVLKESFVSSIRRRGLVELFERSLGMTIGYGDPEKKIEGETESAKKMKKRREVAGLAKGILDAMDSVDEKAEDARKRAHKNRKMRKSKGVIGIAPDGPRIESNAEEEYKFKTTDVEAVWRSVCGELYPENPALKQKWGVENLGIAKRLMVKWGGDNVIYCIEKIIRDWSKYHSNYASVAGVPDMKSIAYNANLWFSEILEGRDMRSLSRDQRSLREGEYRDDGSKSRSRKSFIL